jgi:hypothetical protein
MFNDYLLFKLAHDHVRDLLASRGRPHWDRRALITDPLPSGANHAPAVARVGR